MNVFGSSKSMGKAVRGPRGFRGKDGSIIDLCSWLPKTVLKNLQENDEKCCFTITDPKNDIKKTGADVTEWISRSSAGMNLLAEKPSREIEQLEENRYVMHFKQTRYSTDDLTLLANPPFYYGFFCITFRVSVDDEQVLISDYLDGRTRYCEIKVTSTEIFIHAHTDQETIPHNCKEWTTLFIEHRSNHTTTHYNYNVNGVTGSMISPAADLAGGGFALGSRWDDTYFLNGQVASLEIYGILHPALFPEDLKKIVIKNQNIEL